MRTSVIALVVAVFACANTAFAGSLVIPSDGYLFMTPAGGDTIAVTEFGIGTSEQDHIAYFTGLPQNPNPNAEVSAGFWTAGSVVNFYQKTDWILQSKWAFSSDTVTPESRTAFMDLDNSLGLGGDVIEQSSATTWRLHLDDAWSSRVDDDDNDLLIDLRLQSVPVPLPTSAWMGLSTLAILATATLLRRPRLARAAA